MPSITAPTLDGNCPHRQTDLRKNLEDRIQDLVDEASGVGSGTLETLLTINLISLNLQRDFLEEPPVGSVPQE
jgi:hypothetical protein